MSYLRDFRERLENDDYSGFLHLWEEYCEIDEVDTTELKKILVEVHNSRLGSHFGQYAETALHLWQKIEDRDEAFDVLRLILDLETTNSPELAEVTFRELQQRYGHEAHFHDKIRLIGLRGRDSFQGAIRNYELLSHLEPGAFVYHTGGWGTGEVMEVSLTREDLVVEFEGVPGLRSTPFENAFMHFVPLPANHFLSRRFGNPDQLENEARKDPVAVVRMLLRDLGPKTAAEIKDEMCELVIPAEEWTKWWQSARAKIKRDTMIATPSTVRKPFHLRGEAVSHGERLEAALEKSRDPAEIVVTIYNFVRDFPEVMREGSSREEVRKHLQNLSNADTLPRALRLKVCALMQELFPEEVDQPLTKVVESMDNLVDAVEEMEIPAFKKRVLVVAREHREDWPELFLKALFTLPQAMLRDYLLKELDSPKTCESLVERIVELIDQPEKYPQLFVWYFQKVMAGEKLPYGTEKEGQCDFFEAFLMLMYHLERLGEHRDLVKKMYNLMCNDRYKMVRDVLDGSSLAFAQEFLLLVSKCHTLSDHDIKIMDSLASVAHPSLAAGKKGRDMGPEEESKILWTTEEGYHKVQEQIRHLGTVEAVKNAREVEEARAHGDLRENADYKGALERRQRIQSELKSLSQQVRQARILTPDDVTNETVGVGNVVELLAPSGETKRFTLLGPWDADPDKGILSFQSRLAQAMRGTKEGESFEHQGENYTVRSIHSYFND